MLTMFVVWREQVVGCQPIFENSESGIYRYNEIQPKVVETFRGTPKLGFESKNDGRFDICHVTQFTLCVSLDISIFRVFPFTNKVYFVISKDIYKGELSNIAHFGTYHPFSTQNQA